MLAVDAADPWKRVAAAAHRPGRVGKPPPEVVRHLVDGPAGLPLPFLDEGHDDERAVAGGDLGHHQRPGADGRVGADLRQLVEPARAGHDAQPPGRGAAQVGDVEVGVEDLAKGAGDRRRGHQQDMGRAALARQRLPLGDAEAVLLVDDGEGEIGEDRAGGEQGVRADDDAAGREAIGARSGGRRGEDRLGGLPLGRRKRGGEQLDAVAQRLQEAAERGGVLARQQVGGRQERPLGPGVGDEREGQGRHRRLARSDVALQQPQHRPWPGEVAEDRLQAPCAGRR